MADLFARSHGAQKVIFPGLKIGVAVIESHLHGLARIRIENGYIVLVKPVQQYIAAVIRVGQHRIALADKVQDLIQTAAPGIQQQKTHPNLNSLLKFFKVINHD